MDESSAGASTASYSLKNKYQEILYLWSVHLITSVNLTSSSSYAYIFKATVAIKMLCYWNLN